MNELQVWKWRNASGEYRWAVGEVKPCMVPLEAIADGFLTEEEASAWMSNEVVGARWRMPPWMVKHCNTAYLPDVCAVIMHMNLFEEDYIRPNETPKNSWVPRVAGAVEALTKLHDLGLLKELKEDELPKPATTDRQPQGDVREKLAALGMDEHDPRAPKIVCALLGHSDIVDVCFGQVTCARCGDMLGDTLAGVYDLKDKVVMNHDCDLCRNNYEALSFEHKFLVPYPFKVGEPANKDWEWEQEEATKRGEEQTGTERRHKDE